MYTATEFSDSLVPVTGRNFSFSSLKIQRPKEWGGVDQRLGSKKPRPTNRSSEVTEPKTRDKNGRLATEVGSFDTQQKISTQNEYPKPWNTCAFS